MIPRFSIRRIHITAYRKPDYEYPQPEARRIGSERFGFVAQNEHTFNIVFLGEYRFVFGIKPRDWYCDAPGDAAHENH